jgi:hypothetical protein
VTWATATCAKKKQTTLVFSGVLGGAGEAQLHIGDRAVLTFSIGDVPEAGEYQQGDYRLKFFILHTKQNRERQGVFCLTVSEDTISAGEPIRLKVTGHGKTGDDNSFFMLSNIPDTLQRLELK